MLLITTIMPYYASVIKFILRFAGDYFVLGTILYNYHKW